MVRHYLSLVYLQWEFLTDHTNMFLSESGFKLFLRDVCAMANCQPTGEIEYLFREYVKLIEYMGVGSDAPDEDSAYYDRIQVLALTAGRILAAPQHHRMSDLRIAQKRAGMVLEDEGTVTQTAVTEELQLKEDTVEILEIQPIPIHTALVVEECAEEVIENPPVEPSYCEGAQVHDRNLVMDKFLPVADFTVSFETKRRRGSLKKIRCHTATSGNKFLEQLPQDQRVHYAFRSSSARVEDPNFKKDRLPHRIRVVSGTQVLDGVKDLEECMYEDQLKRIPERVIANELDKTKLTLSAGEYMLLLRYGTYASRVRPRVKFKQALSVILN